MFLTTPFIDRAENPRLRRREKNVLDNPFYRSGDFTHNTAGVGEFVREQFFLAAAAQDIKRLVRFLSQGTEPTLATT